MPNWPCISHGSFLFFVLVFQQHRNQTFRQEGARNCEPREGDMADLISTPRLEGGTGSTGISGPWTAAQLGAVSENRSYS